MDTRPLIESVAPLLPAGASLVAPLLWILGGALTGGLAGGIGFWLARVSLRGLESAHWTERARAVNPAAFTLSVVSLFPAIAIASMAHLAVGPLSLLHGAALSIPVFAATYLACFWVRWHAMRFMTGRRDPFWRSLHGEFIGYLLLLPHLGVLVAMNTCMGTETGPRLWLVGGLGAIGFLASCWAGGLPLVRLIGGARRASAGLRDVVADVAIRVGVTPRETWVVRWPIANALALPVSQQLVFTDRILEELDEDELAAIAAHELGHLSEPRSVVLARCLGLLAFFPLGFAGPVVARWGEVGGLCLVGGAVLATLCVARVARRMEARADRAAHMHESDDGIYARALEALYRANLAPAVVSAKRPLHGHLYDRMLAAGVTPDYPRPAAPSRWRILAGLAPALGFVLIVLLSAASLPKRLPNWSESAEVGLRHMVVLTGGRRGLHRLGVHEGREGRIAEAVAWLRAAATLNSRDHHSPAYASTLLAWDGQCESADRSLRDAESRVSSHRSESCGWIRQAREAVQGCDATRSSNEL